MFTHGISITRKLGFSNIIMPGKLIKRMNHGLLKGYKAFKDMKRYKAFKDTEGA